MLPRPRARRGLPATPSSFRPPPRTHSSPCPRRCWECSDSWRLRPDSRRPLAMRTRCCSATRWRWFQLWPDARVSAAVHTAPTVAVLLFAMLLLFMGGRIIAATVAGQFHRQGDRPVARVQPRIESALLAIMAAAAAASAVGPRPPFAAVAAASLIAAGVLAGVRILRWRLWALRGRPDLLCLAAGYAWLALGLILYGAALAAARQRRLQCT
jgi:hypothetical protein